MAVALQTLLKPPVILDTVSRIGRGQGRLGRWLGFHYGADASDRGTLVGPAAAGKEVPQRDGVYFIYNRTRTVATGRAPGVGPATIKRQPIGRVPYTLARAHEKIPIDYEELSSLAQMGGPTMVVDNGGQNYLARQWEHLATRFNNFLELMAAALIRGTLYLQAVGDDWVPSLTAPSGAYVTINFQLPAGNLGQLDMLGAGAIIGTTWSNAAAPIITNLGAIIDAYSQTSGYTPTDAWVSPLTWNYIIANTQVINQGGSVNTPFDEYVLNQDNGVRGGAERVATLRAFPMIRWHIISDVLILSGTDTPTPAGNAGTGTLTRVIPDNVVVFMPEVSTDWVDLLHFGEFISEAPGMPATRKPSFHMWKEYCTQPTVVELLALLNCLPRLSVPGALAVGTVIF